MKTASELDFIIRNIIQEDDVSVDFIGVDTACGLQILIGFKQTQPDVSVSFKELKKISNIPGVEVSDISNIGGLLITCSVERDMYEIRNKYAKVGSVMIIDE